MKKNLLIFIIIIALMGIFLYYENNHLTVSPYKFRTDNEDMAGLKIVHITDLHNKSFGKNQIKLITLIDSLEPDVVLFTGDIVDARRDGYENALTLMKDLSSKYPLYRILGNHDYSEDGFHITSLLENEDLITLKDEEAVFYYKDIRVSIKGIQDPISFSRMNREETYLKNIKMGEKADYNILLAHRPEYFYEYAKEDYDLVLSGHSHGGQIRLPFIGGIVAPHQGIFPKFDGGLYEEKNTKMIVSRGLGNSLFPFRVFNKPEVVFIEFESQTP